MGFFSDRQNNYSKEKGDLFEQYIQRLFPKNFIIERWTTDIMDKRNGIFVESNLDPDFIIRNEPTKERFAIECKYRSEAKFIKKEGFVEWSNENQLKRYKEFEKKEGIPVFIMIGLYGKPDDPDFLFCVPLSEITEPIISEKIFANYERLVQKPLFFKNNLII